MAPAALTILAKDLRLRLRDRSVLLFAVVVPLGLTVVFSFVFPDPEEIELTAAVVDHDGGEVAAGFVDGVLPALVDEGVLTLVPTDDEASARAAVEAGDLDATWLLPAGLSADVTAGDAAAIEVLVASGRSLQGEVARGVAQGYASQVEQVGLAVATMVAATGRPPDPARVAAAAEAQLEPPVTVEAVRTGAGEPLDAISYLAAGMAVFFVFFTVQFGVTGLLEERQQGTMFRLLAAPIPRWSVQLGKLLGAFLLGVVSMTVLAVTSTLLLGASWGPSAGVAMLIVAAVVAALGVMALVGGFARTAEQAGNLQSIVAVVLGLFGGVFFPVPGEGLLLTVATSISPHSWFMRGISELAVSGDVRVVWPAVAAMLAFGLIAAIPAALLQRGTVSW